MYQLRLLFLNNFPLFFFIYLLRPNLKKNLLKFTLGDYINIALY